MRTLEEVRSELRAILPELRARWPIASLGVFGSYVRGEQGEDSDLDLLVDLDRPVSLFTFLEMEEEIGRRLGLRVEMVTRPALRPYAGDSILRELVPV
jgi:predicted nucleotidyltransferase